MLDKLQKWRDRGEDEMHCKFDKILAGSESSMAYLSQVESRQEEANLARIKMYAANSSKSRILYNLEAP